MKYRHLRSVSIILVLLTLALLLSGCDALESIKAMFRSPKYNYVKTVEINGDTATVIYKNGFRFEVSNISDRIACYGQSNIPAFIRYHAPEAVTTEDKTLSPYPNGTYYESSSDLPGGWESDTVSPDEAFTDPIETEPSTLPPLPTVNSYDSNGDPLVITDMGIRILSTPHSFVTPYLSVIEHDGKKQYVQPGELVPQTGPYFYYENKSYEFADKYFYDYVNERIIEFEIESHYQGYPVKKIWSCGFATLTNLERIVIPNTVDEIFSAAFYGCQSLTEIVFLGTTEEWNAIVKGENWDMKTGNYTVYCTDGAIRPTAE